MQSFSVFFPKWKYSSSKHIQCCRLFTCNILKRFANSKQSELLSSLVPTTGTLIWKSDLLLKAQTLDKFFRLLFLFLRKLKNPQERRHLRKCQFFHKLHIFILPSIMNHPAAAITTGLACFCFVKDQIWYNTSFFFYHRYIAQ